MNKLLDCLFLFLNFTLIANLNGMEQEAKQNCLKEVLLYHQPKTLLNIAVKNACNIYNQCDDTNKTKLLTSLNNDLCEKILNYSESRSPIHDTTYQLSGMGHLIGRNIPSIKLSPCGKRVTYLSKDNTLFIFEFDNQNKILKCSGTINSVHCFAFNKRGDHILFSSNNHPNEIMIYSLNLSECVGSLKIPENQIYRLASYCITNLTISRHGRYVAAVLKSDRNHSLVMWNIEKNSFNIIFENIMSEVLNIEFNPDETQLISEIRQYAPKWAWIQIFNIQQPEVLSLSSKYYRRFLGLKGNIQFVTYQNQACPLICNEDGLIFFAIKDNNIQMINTGFISHIDNFNADLKIALIPCQNFVVAKLSISNFTISTIREKKIITIFQENLDLNYVFSKYSDFDFSHDGKFIALLSDESVKIVYIQNLVTA